MSRTGQLLHAPSSREHPRDPGAQDGTPLPTHRKDVLLAASPARGTNVLPAFSNWGSPLAGAGRARPEGAAPLRPAPGYTPHTAPTPALAEAAQNKPALRQFPRRGSVGALSRTQPEPAAPGAARSGARAPSRPSAGVLAARQPLPGAAPRRPCPTAPLSHLLPPAPSYGASPHRTTPPGPQLLEAPARATPPRSRSPAAAMTGRGGGAAGGGRDPAGPPPGTHRRRAALARPRLRVAGTTALLFSGRGGTRPLRRPPGSGAWRAGLCLGGWSRQRAMGPDATAEPRPGGTRLPRERPRQSRAGARAAVL